MQGALAALCLDLELRLRSSITLDEVMRELWRRHGRDGRGVPERGLEQVAIERSGLPLGSKFDQWIRSTAELPLGELLAEFAVDAKQRASLGDADPGGRIGGKAQGASLGLKLRPGDTTIAHVLAGGPAQRAGLSGGDVVAALDGLRVTPGQWPLRLGALNPGQAVAVHYFRGDELLQARLVAEPLPLDAWVLTLAENASPERLARRKAWLGA